MLFPWHTISVEDKRIAERFIDRSREPDLVIHSSGRDYLWRWYVTEHIDHADPERGRLGQTYFHIQTGDDDDRGLHDHPWPSMSVILAGGYNEEVFWGSQGWGQATTKYQRQPGDFVFRPANEAHRLTLPEGVKYTMTQFSTGPILRDWGFYMPGGWISHEKAFQDRAIKPNGEDL